MGKSVKLVLVRHGRTASNVAGALDSGRPGAPLDSRGNEQAAHLAQRWGELVGQAPSAIAVSPITRARQTASFLAKQYSLVPIVAQGIREIRAGDLEMNADPISIATYFSTVLRWAAEDLSPRMPGGENGYEVLDRALPAVTHILHQARQAQGDDAVAVIVAHGALNRLLATTLCHNITVQIVAKYRMENASTTVLEVPAGFAPSSPQDMRGILTARTWNDRPLSDWVVEDTRSELQ